MVAHDNYDSTQSEHGVLALADKKAKSDQAPAKGSGLYVRRNVTNGHDIIAHMKAQGFKSAIQPGDMHVTIAHSTSDVDQTATGQAKPSLTAEGGDRRIKPLGGKGAVVLHFDSDELQKRHAQFNDAGATWDFPSYQPHVTMTYNGDDLDTGDMQPYDGPIEFGPEIAEPLNDDWAGSVVEKIAPRHIAKVEQIDESLGLVFGYGIVCKTRADTDAPEPYYDLNIDKDGERVAEHIPEHSMLKAAAHFAKGDRPGNDMHDGPDCGTYDFLFPVTADIAKAMGWTVQKTGLAVGFRPPADMLAKFINKTYSGFSIEGSRIRAEEYESE